MEEQKKKQIVTAKEMAEPAKQNFFVKDAKAVGEFLWGDKIIPGIKKFMYDIFINGLHMALFGNGTSAQNGNVNYAAPYQQVSYRSYDQAYKPQQAQKPIVPQGLNYDRLLYSSRGDAEKVLIQLGDIIDEYGVARVSDLYDIVGVTPQPTAHNYGWKSVVNAKVMPVADGFVINFPQANPINK